MFSGKGANAEFFRNPSCFSLTFRPMGSFIQPFPVKPFCAIMAPGTSLLKAARDLVESNWGPCDLTGEIFEVEDYTDYYRERMPAGLLKQFLSFEALRDVETMNQGAKFWSNNMEDRHRSVDGQRRINLDPGYLTLDKLVLYTTKNFSHRLWLRDGLFAEITLSYGRQWGQYQPHDYTYPDYVTPQALDFFLAMRQRLARTLSRLEESL